MSVTTLSPSVDHWPKGLREQQPGKIIPEMLSVKGDTEVLTMPSVTITGARACTEYGIETTTELARRAVETGYAVVTGLSYGIDARAAQAALDFGGTVIGYTPTINELQMAKDRAYPAGHARLFESILEDGGALVSRPAIGPFQPLRQALIERTQLMVAHGDALILPEAGIRSSSVYAARYAMELGKPVGAVPGPITSASSAGANKLIQEGAQLISDAHEFIAGLSTL